MASPFAAAAPTLHKWLRPDDGRVDIHHCGIATLCSRLPQERVCAVIHRTSCRAARPCENSGLPVEDCSVGMATHRLEAPEAFDRPKLTRVVIGLKRRRSLREGHPTNL